MPLCKFPAANFLIFACLAGAVVPSALAQIFIENKLPNGDSYECVLSGLKGMGSDCGTKYDEMVFTAEILAIDPGPGNEFRLTLRPLKVFKGDPAVGVKVYTAQHRCLPEMKTGDHWLFSVDREGESKNLTVNFGSRSGPEAEEAGNIAFLDRLESLDHAGLVKGYAYFYEETGEHSSEQRPSTNHTVVMTRLSDGSKSKALTDEKGNFDFGPLPVGTYEFEANTKPGLWTRWTGQVDVEAHGCTDFDLDFHVDGQIAGRIVFPAGVDPSTWEVEATPADDPDVFPASDWTDAAGRFVLHGLKPGKYTVEFKQTEMMRKGPNLVVDIFAPGTPNRLNAQVIEIGKATRVEGIEIAVPRTALK